MLYRGALESANLIKVGLVTTAAMLAICLLALAETTNTAGAISLPKNGKIAFSGIRPRALNTTFNYEIYTINADGSDLHRLTNNAAVDAAPAWSPDGTKIAFTRGDLGREHIYVMNADGTEQRRLTNDPGEDSHPAWSPDGTKIAFARTGLVRFDIFIMDAAGGNMTRLTHNPGASANPTWSPDGTKVAFERWGKPTPGARANEIYTMNVDGTGEKALTNNRVYEGLPDWSPDGRRIVLAGEGGTYVMNSNGTEKRALHRYGSYPAWSPDGKKILFASETDDYIAAINPDGSGLTYISRTPHMDVNFELDWQPLPRTVHQPDTGGLSLLLAASALLISGGVMFYAGLKRRM